MNRRPAFAMGKATGRAFNATVRTAVIMAPGWAWAHLHEPWDSALVALVVVACWIGLGARA